MPRRDRPARIRRITRLLVALGESPEVASAAARELSRRIVDGPRGEQLVIIEHRERVPGGGDRGHEAWVLRHVLGWNERDAARALDCSRTALRLHLAARPAGTAESERARIREMRARMAAVPMGTVPPSDRMDGRTHRLLGRGVVVVLIVVLIAVATRVLG